MLARGYGQEPRGRVKLGVPESLGVPKPLGSQRVAGDSPLVPLAW